MSAVGSLVEVPVSSSLGGLNPLYLCALGGVDDRLVMRA